MPNKKLKTEEIEESSDSDSDYEEDSNFKIDNAEYNKFLSKLFPSKYMKDKMNKIKKKQEEEDDDEDDEDDEDEEYEECEVEEECEDEEECKEEVEDETEEADVESSKLNIVLNLSDLANEELYDDLTDDEEEEDEEATQKELEMTKEKISELEKELKYLEMYLGHSEKLEDGLKTTKIHKTFCVKAKETKKKIEKEKKKIESTLKQKNSKKFKKIIKQNSGMNELSYFNKLEIEEQNVLLNKLEGLSELITIDKPYRFKLLETDIPNKFKSCALKKLNILKTMDPYSGEYHKMKMWIDRFMEIPFNQYTDLPVSYEKNTKEECVEFMNNSVDILNEAAYGMNDAKLQIMQIIGTWIANPNAMGTAIVLKGPAGTGKTTLVKDGISKILKRNFELISLGGINDGCYLDGHSSTYEGAVPGKMVDVLIKGKTCSPVILFDELDKISDTPKGDEIVGILTHLTDVTQNNNFNDKYFSEINFDFSKSLFIFTCNEYPSRLGILLDRMYKIETGGYSVKEKLIIAKQYLLPKIIKQIKFNEEDIVLEDDIIKYIIEQCTEGEKGVRNLKRCLEIIYTKLNLYRLSDSGSTFFEEKDKLTVKFPYTIDRNIVDKLVKNKKNEIFSTLYM